MSDFKLIKFEHEEGKARLTLNNPPDNFLSVEMLEEIVGALDVIRDKESLKILEINSTGKDFCGGVNLKDLTAEKVGELMPHYSRMFNHLNDICGLTVAVVHGEAKGFGAELAAFCDVTIAAESATFSFPQITFGLFPPIATAILPRIIGRNRALDWIISGRIVSAKEAVEAHLIARTIPDLVLNEYADNYFNRISGFSAPAVVLAKRAVDTALYMPAMDALRVTESTYMLDLMNSLDPHEGLSAFIEGRYPVWKNR